MEQRKKVTLKDIAARTGLSVNTVSRVLNKKPYYTKEVEERVNAACKELGYIVDMNASGLRSGSTRTVAILYDDLVNPFYSYTTDIISKRLEEHGYNSIMFSNNNRSPYADYELMRAVYSRKPDGVLSFLEPTEDLVPFIQNSGIPFVIFGRDGAPYGMLGINADEVRGGAVAGKHLLDCGCRRPVYAGSWHDVKVCLDRQKGFAEALAEGGVELSPEQIIYAREVPFETLIDQHPEDVDLKLMFGSLLLAQDKKEEARFQFELATEIEPTNDGAWKSLLQMAIREENIGEVVRICQRCTELFPEAPEYYFYLGIGYFQQEKYDDALTAYRAGLKVIPKENLNLRSDFYGQIGDIYYQIKNLPEAYKAYDEALKYNADNVVVLNNYSYFLTLEKKDLKKAERMIARCIQLEPDNATYLDTYAWVFFTQGNYVLAKIYIENAISKDTTESADLVDHYGDILYMNGNKEKALEQWKKAAKLGKDTEVLREKIEKGEYIEDKNAAYNESF